MLAATCLITMAYYYVDKNRRSGMDKSLINLFLKKKKILNKQVIILWWHISATTRQMFLMTCQKIFIISRN